MLCVAMRMGCLLSLWAHLWNTLLRKTLNPSDRTQVPSFFTIQSSISRRRSCSSWEHKVTIVLTRFSKSLTCWNLYFHSKIFFSSTCFISPDKTCQSGISSRMCSVSTYIKFSEGDSFDVRFPLLLRHDGLPVPAICGDLELLLLCWGHCDRRAGGPGLWLCWCSGYVLERRKKILILGFFLDAIICLSGLFTLLCNFTGLRSTPNNIRFLLKWNSFQWFDPAQTIIWRAMVT